MFGRLGTCRSRWCWIRFFSTACTAENPRRAGKRHFSLSKLPVRQRTRGGARHRAGILSKLPVRQRTAIPGPPACLNISKLPVRQRTVPRSSSWPTIFSKLPVRQRTCSCSCSCSCSFSKLPVRQRTAWIVGWFLPTFLSCLCGSERAAPTPWPRGFSAACAAANEIIDKLLDLVFFCCLCGSEQEAPAPAPAHAFLSCLCGSEPGWTPFRTGAFFLSCLCGSELPMSVGFGGVQFLLPVRQRTPGCPRRCGRSLLSCLCGSERSDSGFRLQPAFQSCLCGSERITTRSAETSFSKLPVRQRTLGSSSPCRSMISKLPVRQRTALLPDDDGVVFLSCLCGSERGS